MPYSIDLRKKSSCLL